MSNVVDISRLFALLDECVVQVLVDGTFRGTGFFVAPGHVLTCAHVLISKGVVVDPERITLVGQHERFTARKPKVVPAEHGSDVQFALPDLALIAVKEPHEHNQVLLAEREPRHRGQLTARGFSMTSERAPKIGLETRTLTAAGPATEAGCLHVADGQLVGGMSGSPVIDEETGLVCGFVKASRDQRSNLGGWIITVAAFDQHLPELRELTDRKPNSQWQAVLDQNMPQDETGAAWNPVGPMGAGQHGSLLKEDYSVVFEDLRRTHFTPRPWLANLIQAFLDDKPRGYFFVEGKTGVGKTTLAAELARQGNYPHHFCLRSESRTTTISAALTSLAAQLIARYDLSPGSAPPAAQELPKSDNRDPSGTRRDVGSPLGFRTLLEEAAEKATRRNEKLVLVIDGLDRAESCIGALPLGLPTVLPDNAYVIATLRKGKLLDERLQPYDHVTIKSDDSRVLVDIQRHIDDVLQIDSRLRARVTEKISAGEFRETIVERCGGWWRYVSVVLADVRDGRRSADTLSGLPTDLWTEYSRTLGELEDGADGDLCVPVLSTLACAAEPLSLSTLVTLAGIDTERQSAAANLVIGPMGSFVESIDDEIEGPYVPRNDSARDFLIGDRPDTQMSGDPQRLDSLASTARATHNRIADRYLTEWGDLKLKPGLPFLMADLELGLLDGGYGLRHLASHLEYAGREDDVHRLLSEHPWFVVHEEWGMYTEYRWDLVRGKRLAARSTDSDLAAGRNAPAIGKEIRYALMDASVESVSASMTPGLLRAFVERGRLGGPEGAVRHIRAVVDYPKRVELVAALIDARFLGENASHLVEEAAVQAWDLVFPPRTGRSWEVAGELLRRLPQPIRDGVTDNLLRLGIDPSFPSRGRLLGMLGPSLSESDLERALDAVLTAESDRTEADTALIGLVPHLPDSLLSRIDQDPDSLIIGYGSMTLNRVLALRLAASNHPTSEWRVKRIVHEVRQLIGGHGNQEMPWCGGVLGALMNRLDSSRRTEELDKIVLNLKNNVRQNNHFPPYDHNGAAFFSEQQVQRALTIARSIPKPAAPARAKALSWLVPGVPEEQRPDVVAEALKALQRPGSNSFNDHLRLKALLSLMPYVTERNIPVTRKLVHEMISSSSGRLGPDHAGLLAILAGRVSNHGESAQLCREAVGAVAECLGESRPEAIEVIAPYLDRETRLMALELVPGIASDGVLSPRWRALDALVSHAQDEDELRRAWSIAKRIHDPLPQSIALASLAHYDKKHQVELRDTVEKLAEAADSKESVGSLITLAQSFPEKLLERYQILRRAAALIPVDPRVGGRHLSEHLAAVCPVLTPSEIHDRLLAAVDRPDFGQWRGIDIWAALTPGISAAQLNRAIKAVEKRWKRLSEFEVERIATTAPYLQKSKIEKYVEFAMRCSKEHRSMPLAALAHRLDEPLRSQVLALVLEDIRPRRTDRREGSPSSVYFRLVPQLLVALASAMTDNEREELIDIVITQRQKEVLVLVEALAELFERLPEKQRTRVMQAATAELPKSFVVRGRRANFNLNRDDLNLNKVVRHADVTFLQKLIDVARYSTGELKVEAIAAVLGSPTTAKHRSWVADGDHVGPIRDLFSGLSRPDMLTILGAAAPHIGHYGGSEAAEECVHAVKDVACWWP